MLIQSVNSKLQGREGTKGKINKKYWTDCSVSVIAQASVELHSFPAAGVLAFYSKFTLPTVLNFPPSHLFVIYMFYGGVICSVIPWGITCGFLNHQASLGHKVNAFHYLLGRRDAVGIEIAQKWNKKCIIFLAFLPWQDLISYIMFIVPFYSWWFRNTVFWSRVHLKEPSQVSGQTCFGPLKIW